MCLNSGTERSVHSAVVVNVYGCNRYNTSTKSIQTAEIICSPIYSKSYHEDVSLLCCSLSRLAAAVARQQRQQQTAKKKKRRKKNGEVRVTPWVYAFYEGFCGWMWAAACLPSRFSVSITKEQLYYVI